MPTISPKLWDAEAADRAFVRDKLKERDEGGSLVTDEEMMPFHTKSYPSRRMCILGSFRLVDKNSAVYKMVPRKLHSNDQLLERLEDESPLSLTFAGLNYDFKRTLRMACGSWFDELNPVEHLIKELTNSGHMLAAEVWALTKKAKTDPLKEVALVKFGEQFDLAQKDMHVRKSRDYIKTELRLESQNVCSLLACLILLDNLVQNVERARALADFLL